MTITRKAQEFFEKVTPEDTDIFHYSDPDGLRLRMSWTEFITYLNTTLAPTIQEQVLAVKNITTLEIDFRGPRLLTGVEGRRVENITVSKNGGPAAPFSSDISFVDNDILALAWDYAMGETNGTLYLDFQ